MHQHPINSITIMRLDNECYTAQLLEQLRPQQLDTNLFFGPLNALTQTEFLEQHGIKFFIGVGIDTPRLASLVQEGARPSGYAAEGASLMVNFDENFDWGSLAAAGESTQLYHSLHSERLRELVTAHESRLEHVIQRGMHHYTQSNVFSDGVFDRFQSFNDLVLIFKTAAHLGNILVFSQNGNDEELLMLLVFVVLQKYSCVEPTEAVRFIKCLRPTVRDLTAEQLHWCVKAQETFGMHLQPPAAQRAGATRKCSEEGDPEIISIFKSTKRSRLNQ